MLGERFPGCSDGDDYCVSGLEVCEDSLGRVAGCVDYAGGEEAGVEEVDCVVAGYALGEMGKDHDDSGMMVVVVSMRCAMLIVMYLK